MKNPEAERSDVDAAERDWDAELQARLEGWRADGLARRLRTAHGDGTRVTLDGRAVVSFAANDYLGLAQHPKLVAAAQAAVAQSGCGATASPLIAGHRGVHADLERALAAFKGSAQALVFPSGFQASLATLGALLGPDDSVLLDRLAHACLIDGAKLSGARLRVFKHNDVADLERLLQAEAGRRCLVAVESVYSMDGDVAPLAELAALCARHRALLLVDEAHATGVLGPGGQGALAEVFPGALPDGVLALGTLSKALGAQGGYLCAPERVCSTVVHAGRAYLFSTALAPASAAAARAALEVVRDEAWRRERVLGLAARVRAALRRLGCALPPGERATPIVPWIVGAEQAALERSEALLARGLFVPAVRYPTVKRGAARLRISLSAAHTDEDVERLLAELQGLQ